MMARRTRATGFMSMQWPSGHSAEIASSWPIIYMYVWPQQPELGSPTCPTTPSILR
ncbi:hypothetical protein PR202_gb29449 [Eleusine coracana subsp. coracana]|uniref:Uncharacterized protein n=1 Tax=Eleusine coracana subsp. coracana TaxID=191504 RepID=A0AAV5G0C0_ELECO|nr:hypothetical protein PR202_gb29449 [Eleusine coracana subsp. coracana]